jgi:nonsense-mediated mRNA decay protein 3
LTRLQGFLEDLDEDPVYRQTVNIYKDAQRVTMKVDADDEDEKMTEDGDLPEPPTLQEMLDDLDLDRKESEEGDEVMDGQ